MMHILASARAHYEFRTAEAINDAGGLAIVPRKVSITPPKDGKPAKIEYRPFIPNYMFLAVTEKQWHDVHDGRLCDVHGKLLPPFRKVLDIIPRTWGEVQAFDQRAELECDYRLKVHERGLRVQHYKRGDILRIFGADLLDGQLHDTLATFIKLDAQGRIVAETGARMMGKPVLITLDGANVGAVD